MRLTHYKVSTESAARTWDERKRGHWLTCLTISALFVVLGASAQAQVSGPIDATVLKEVAESFASKLANDYARADLGQEMAEAIRKKLAAGGYAGIASAEELANTLQADTRSISHDKHLRVIAPQAGSGGAPRSMPPMGKQNGFVRRAEILEGNVGYMEVNAVMPARKEAIAAAFAFLHETDALIIDLRGNGGGAPDVVAHYMSYLSEGEPYAVMRIKPRHGDITETRTTDLRELSYGKRKPVFALTSSQTFSGGEEFAYDLQAFKRGTIVGEVTGGGGNPGSQQALAHGFATFLPFGVGVHPVTGGSWEGVGVRPEVEVPAALALKQAHRLAVERLQGESSDAKEAAALGELAAKLADELNAAKATRVASRQLSKQQREFIGAYRPVGGGEQSLSVVEKDGALVLQSNRRPPLPLIAVTQQSYRVEGMPEDFTASFRSTTDGKTRLFVHLGGWPPLPVMEKQ